MTYKKIILFFQNVYGRQTILCSVVTAIIILLIDFLTGKEIKFPIYYLVPTGMAAWKNRKIPAYMLALAMPLIRLGFHIPWQELESFTVELINEVFSILAIILFVYMIDRIALQNKELNKEVKILEGLLPICSSCKRIKNKKGEYVQLEKYISQHSEATFTHGLCEDCAKKLYPEEYKEIMKRDKKFGS